MNRVLSRIKDKKIFAGVVAVFILAAVLFAIFLNMLPDGNTPGGQPDNGATNPPGQTAGSTTGNWPGETTQETPMLTPTPTPIPTPDPTILQINSVEAFNSLLTDGILKVDEQIKTVEFSGEMTLEGFRVTQPVTLRFVGNVAVNGEVVVDIAATDATEATEEQEATDEAEEKNTVTIDTTQNNANLQKAITMEAPDTHVIWNGKDAPDFATIQQYQNVKSYNGQACNEHLGGAGTTKLLSGTIKDKKNDNKSVSFETDGNYIFVTMGYMNTVDLSNAQISAKLDGEGNAAIKEVDGTYYCIVTDAQQKERGYQLQVSYKEYTLPVIHITTESGKAVNSKETYVNGNFSIDYNGNGAYLGIENATMQIRGRGHSSWELAKKPYKIKFEEKVPLFGLKAAKEWVLQANYIDRSLMRNQLAMSMGSLLNNMVFIPHSYMVDVFVNGEYQGVYSLTEQIEMKEGRIPGEKDSTEVDCDYLVEFGGEKEETSFGSNVFSTTLCKYVEIKTPDTDVLSAEQYQYIKDYFQQVDDAIIAQSGYEEYIDIPSLIDWFILHEFSYNTDCTLRRSNFFLKKKGGKLYVAAPWDFDYAFGNMSLDSNNYEEWISLGNSKTDSFDEYIKTNWMDYLLKDENFQKQLKARWNEVGESLYQKALATINANDKQIGLSADENFTKWNKCLGVKLQYESKKTLALDTYEDQVDYLREFIKNRYEWMDKTIGKM